MNETPKTGPVDLPEWAAKLLNTPLDLPSPQSTDFLRGDVSWPLLVNAAVVSTFLPRELAPDVLSGAARKDAEKAVLRFAETKHDQDGVRWTLTHDARRAVLTACDAGDITDTVETLASRGHDPVTLALQDYLRGSMPPDLEGVDERTLEGMRVAASWLSGVSYATPPPVEEIDRQLDLRHLLAPFERMTGKQSEGDRFYGRRDEMEDLREYVGVIAAETFQQRLSRGVKALRRFIAGRQPKAVWGIGGVGKTTLIAKFMLEHARAAASRFPFAYLDFDRASVTARNRASLLGEMCQQVGAQFPTLTSLMTTLQDRASALARQVDLNPELDMFKSALQPLLKEFRDVVDQDDSASGPFLLVFDTFEIVQYGPDQVIALEKFVQMLSNNGDWPRLRLIIAGRQKVASFNGTVEDLELGPLSPEGSAEMLMALAADAGKPIEWRDAVQLVAAIIQRSRARSTQGVRPLRLRLVGELFKNADNQKGREVVKSLLADLNNPHSSTSKTFVDGVLVRRILGHVRDVRVKALADPGLVVRRITREVIREVMTRGTQKPDGSGEIPPDRETIEPWIVDEAEAADIFNAFSREVSLVEPDGAGALRHRQDVREDMLPLIEGSRPHGFRRIHQLAYDHFRSQARENAADFASAAEAIYHGLWLERPFYEIVELWPRAASFDPRIDAEEFPPDSPARLFVRAKTNAALTREEIRRLPQVAAVEWLASKADTLLQQKRVDSDAVGDIQAAAGDQCEALDARRDVAAPVTRVFYRAGLWAEAGRLAERHLSAALSSHDDDSVSIVRSWATIAARSGRGHDSNESLVDWARSLRDPLIRTEVLAHEAIRWMSVRRDKHEEIRGEVRDAVRHVRLPAWRRDLRVLRLAIASNPYDIEQLLEIFVAQCDHLAHDRSVAAAVSQIRSQETSIVELDGVWAEERPRFMQAIRSRPDLIRTIAAADHSDWVVPFGNALSRGLRVGERKSIENAASGLLYGNRHSDARRALKSGDGLSLLESLVDGAVMLTFAKALAERHSQGLFEWIDSAPAQEETAADIASALVGFHRKTVMDDEGLNALA